MRPDGVDPKDVHHRLLIDTLEPVCPAATIDAGVVDKKLQPIGPGPHLLARGADVIGCGHVKGKNLNRVGMSSGKLLQLGRLAGLAARSEEATGRARQLSGPFEPDATVGTGDQCPRIVVKRHRRSGSRLGENIEQEGLG